MEGGCGGVCQQGVQGQRVFQQQCPQSTTTMPQTIRKHNMNVSCAWATSASKHSCVPLSKQTKPGTGPQPWQPKHHARVVQAHLHPTACPSTTATPSRLEKTANPTENVNMQDNLIQRRPHLDLDLVGHSVGVGQDAARAQGLYDKPGGGALGLAAHLPGLRKVGAAARGVGECWGQASKPVLSRAKQRSVCSIDARPVPVYPGGSA